MNQQINPPLDPQKTKRRPPLKLPFNNRRQDSGAWAYDHRIGLLSTLIVYLVIAIAFVGGKIYVGHEPHTQGMYIDLEQLSELEQLRDELQEQVEQKQQLDWGSISNRVSNENSMDERVLDDRGSDVSELNRAAEQVQQQMAQNREAFEQGLNQVDKMRDRDNSEGGDSSQKRDSKVSGGVTVSYSFSDPVRHSRDLIIPAYRCEGGGDVEVEVILNPYGEITSAKVVRGGDDCMQQTALRAARQSTFNIDRSAPDKQKGRITYVFIPQ